MRGSPVGGCGLCIGFRCVIREPLCEIAMHMYLRLPIVGLFLVGLLALQGCARTVIHPPASPQDNAPNSIRTLGPDQRFTTRSSDSVALHVRARQAGQPINILALSGGGADG